MSALCAVFKREFAAYFATPIAFVFLVIFLVAMGVFTFYVGRFYELGRAGNANRLYRVQRFAKSRRVGEQERDARYR